MQVLRWGAASIWMLVGCAPSVQRAAPPNTLVGEPTARVRTAAFVVTQGVFNSELMAPYDVLHHTLYRDKTDYIAPFVVARDLEPVVTFEGLTVLRGLRSCPISRSRPPPGRTSW